MIVGQWEELVLVDVNGRRKTRRRHGRGSACEGPRARRGERRVDYVKMKSDWDVNVRMRGYCGITKA